MSCKGELGNVPDRGGGTFEQYPEGGTVSVAHKGDLTKSVYLNFDPSGMSTINWSKIDQESGSKKSSRWESNKITKVII